MIGSAAQERVVPAQLVANARAAEAAGFASAWVSHVPWSLDALTALTLAAGATESIELGTAVVPTYPRHPMSLAQAALSVQAASRGRLTLGIGPSHPYVIQTMYGLTWERPAHHTAEYVQALRACLATGPDDNTVSVDGDVFRFTSMLEVPGGSPVPILVAALAPQMLELTGRLADGTVTTWADGRAVADHVVPRIVKAAADAGRPAPRVVVNLPVAVVDDADRARTRAAELFSAYEGVPTYQRVFERNRSPRPVDAAVIGDERTVADRIRHFGDLGATDFLATVLGLGNDPAASRDCTFALLASLL